MQMRFSKLLKGAFAGTTAPHTGSLSAISRYARPSYRLFSTGASSFRCNECGQPYSKWQGQCSSCSVWGKIEQATEPSAPYRQTHLSAKASKSKASNWLGGSSHGKNGAAPAAALRMNDVDIATAAERVELPDRELVRLMRVYWCTRMVCN